MTELDKFYDVKLSTPTVSVVMQYIQSSCKYCAHDNITHKHHRHTDAQTHRQTERKARATAASDNDAPQYNKNVDCLRARQKVTACKLRNLSLNEPTHVAQNHPLSRLMSTFGAMHAGNEWMWYDNKSQYDKVSNIQCSGLRRKSTAAATDNQYQPHHATTPTHQHQHCSLQHFS